MPMKYHQVRCQEGTIYLIIFTGSKTVCSMDVILRNELTERAKAGDRCLVIGCPIVVPDISQLFNDPSLQKDSNNRISGLFFQLL